MSCPRTQDDIFKWYNPTIQSFQLIIMYDKDKQQILTFKEHETGNVCLCLKIF